MVMEKRDGEKKRKEKREKKTLSGFFLIYLQDSR
jgi:hypothetical protein